MNLSTRSGTTIAYRDSESADFHELLARTTLPLRDRFEIIAGDERTLTFRFIDAGGRMVEIVKSAADGTLRCEPAAARIALGLHVEGSGREQGGVMALNETLELMKSNEGDLIAHRTQAGPGLLLFLIPVYMNTGEWYRFHAVSNPESAQ